MQKLYEKVMKGQYPRIPKMYSKELAIVIKSMLQVKPKYRPTCDELIEHKIVQSKFKELGVENQFDNLPIKSFLMSDLDRDFKKNLPSPNYDIDVDVSIDKDKPENFPRVHKNHSIEINE